MLQPPVPPGQPPTNFANALGFYAAGRSQLVAIREPQHLGSTLDHLGNLSQAVYAAYVGISIASL